MVLGGAKLEEIAVQAFIFLVVYLIGTGVLFAFYCNLYVLDDYLLALFWAVICSIPLFQIKLSVIHYILSFLKWWWSEQQGKYHWLGAFRPYDSFGDVLFRDLPTVRSLRHCSEFILKPLGGLFSGEAGSEPYFGLLIRLCLVQFANRWLGLEALVVFLFVGVQLYLTFVCIRVLFTLVAWLGPRALLRASTVLSKKIKEEHLQLVSRRFQGVCAAFCICWQDLQTITRKLGTWAFAACLDQCHNILSTLIIAISLFMAYKAMSFFLLSLRQEVNVIWHTLVALLSNTPMYQDAKAKVSQFFNDTRAQTQGFDTNPRDMADILKVVGAMVPGYQEWLQSNVPDLEILHRVMKIEDWLPSGLATFMEALVKGRGGPAVDEDLCGEAIAAGAACEATGYATGVPLQQQLQQQLQNTTCVLQMLLDGNISDALAMSVGAYAELSTATSLLGVDISVLSEGGSRLLDPLTWLARATMQGAIGSYQMVARTSSFLGQAVVFLTALFYLLAAKASCLEFIRVLLTVIDRSQVIFKLSELVVRAVLLSALKMSAFHALFTWLLYSWAQVPVVVVPSVLTALFALVPLVSPVGVSVGAAIYLWAQHRMVAAFIVLVVNVGVWWQVPTVIYAEIPESNPFLTGLSVVLGIGQFGVIGVVLGPLIASVPLICFNMLKHFNDRSEEAPEDETSKADFSKRPRRSLFTLYRNDSLFLNDERHLPAWSESDSEAILSPQSGPPWARPASQFQVAQKVEEAKEIKDAEEDMAQLINGRKATEIEERILQSGHSRTKFVTKERNQRRLKRDSVRKGKRRQTNPEAPGGSSAPLLERQLSTEESSVASRPSSVTRKNDETPAA